MARVTVEDCLARVPNRFALTILASRRARTLLEGKGKAMVECDNKSAVTALREIGSGAVRFIEDVDTVMGDFIEEQRTRLRASATDGSYLDAAAFGIEGEEGEEVGADIEELTADLERLGTKPKEKTTDTDDDEVEAEEEADEETESSSDDEEIDESSDIDEDDLGEIDGEIDGEDLGEVDSEDAEEESDED